MEDYFHPSAEMGAACRMLRHLGATEALWAHRRIRSAAERFRAGIGWAPPFVQKRLRAIDRRLRCRWDVELRAPVIERLNPMDREWTTILPWPRDEERAHYSLEYVEDLLRRGDIQRLGPREWLRLRREQAERARARNAKAAEERVLAAVDSLDSKRLKNFIEVETAIRRGEKVIAGGDAERFLERARAASRDAPPLPAEATNPGMAPGIFDRKGIDYGSATC